MNKTDKLVTYLRASAFQRRFMQPWLRDKEFASQGGTMLYAVDNDVIKLFTAPEENSAATPKRKWGYAQVLPDETPEVSVAVGRALAHYIFFQLANDRAPLLIIPPLEVELATIYFGIAHDTGKEHNTASGEFDRLRALVSRIGQNPTDDDLLKLEKSAPHLSQLLAGRSGPTAEFKRFNRLLAKQRIAPPGFVVEQGCYKDPVVRNALAQTLDLRDMLRLHDLRENWLSLLRDAKSGARSMVLVEGDAHALAYLEWCNRQLRDRYRLVMITGDWAVHKAARNYTPEGEKYSFAELYLRHPRCYLAEVGVLAFEGRAEANMESNALPDNTGRTELIHWLDTFLGKFQIRYANYMAELDKLLGENRNALYVMAKSVLTLHPKIAGEFRESWDYYTRTILLRHSFQDEPRSDKHQSLVLLADDLNQLLDSLADRLEIRVRDAWNTCFEAATEAGWLLSRQGKQDHRSRNIPTLSFDSFGATRAFVQSVQAFYRKGSRGAGRHKEMIQALRQEDGGDYTYYLAHALLFAAEDVWHVAAILAGRAYCIANQQDIANVSGREAAYLRAVALRQSARHVRNLESVETMLTLAEKCLEQDRQSKPELDAAPIRFLAERVALHLTYQLFSIFQKEKIPEAVPTLGQIEEDAKALLSKLDNLKIIDPWISRNVVRNLLVNLFMSALLRTYKQGEEVDASSFRRMYDQMRNNIESNSDPEIEVSYLVHAIYAAAGLWTAGTREEATGFKRQLRQLLMPNEVQEHSVMPYDIKRFMFLSELTAKAYPRVR